MPLLKSISLNGSSITASFWVPAALEVDFTSNTSIIKLAGYVNGELYASGDKPIMYKSIRWTGSDNPINITNMQAGTAFAAAFNKLIQEQDNPLLPPNPFAGGTLV